MANLSVDGFDEVLKMLDRLSNSEEITKKAITAAEPELEKTVRNTVKSVANKGYATGGLAKSFVGTGAKKNKYGTYSVVRPVGNDPRGISYAKRAAILEYGTDKNMPQPWRQKAINAAQKKCEEIVEKIVSEEVDKITGGS